MLRMVAWARAYRATSATDNWAIGNTSDASARWAKPAALALGVQYRPGYVPPNGAWRPLALVAPEFQLTNESSVVGYVNYMQRAVSKGIGDVWRTTAACCRWRATPKRCWVKSISCWRQAS
jgi:hypothetical protein